MGALTKEYRVWRIKSGDQRGTQGHYIEASSRSGAIEKVRRKGERQTSYDAIPWKEGKHPRTLTKDAKCFQKTGKRCRRD